jgi:DNA-binding transcriptional ArsR family regulator
MDAYAALEAFGALSQETRLKALQLLVAAGPNGLPSGEIARQLGTPHNTMSTHLAVLARAALVTVRRESRLMLHTANLDTLRHLMTFLMRDCCGGQPEACAALFDAILPITQRPAA